MKPMRISEAEKKEILQSIMIDANKKLEEGTFFRGKFEYKAEYVWKGQQKPMTVEITPIAWLKILSLVQYNDKEVGWHGTVSRTDNTHFVIEDIFVYPQKVTGATVTPEYDEYCEWQMSIPVEQFKRMRFHGHSHVNMGTTPSGTDDKFQADTVSMLGEEDFYIFMIINKKGEYNLFLYDYKTNTYYEAKHNSSNPEIILRISDEYDITEFMTESKKLVKSNVASYGYQNGYNYNNRSYSYGSGNYSSYSNKSTVSKQDNSKKGSEDKIIKLPDGKINEDDGIVPAIDEDDICDLYYVTPEYASLVMEDIEKAIEKGNVKNNFDELLFYAEDLIDKKGMYYWQMAGYDDFC